MGTRAWHRSKRLGRTAARCRRAAWEPLEPRLALTWSGVPPATIVPPGVYTGVVLNSLSDATGKASIAGSEVDYYRFVASSTGPYVISAKTPSSNLNPVLGVFSADGKRLTFNDNISSTNRDSQVALNLKIGTTYYVGVTNRFTTSHGSYTWAIDGLWPAPADDAYEQNDSRAAAADLGALTAVKKVSGLIMADDSDWYKFSTLSPGLTGDSLKIEFDGSKGDLDMALYDAAGVLIRRAHGVGNLETISLDGLPADTYSLRVYGYQGARNPSYSLTIDPPAIPPDPIIELSGSSLNLGIGVNWDESLSVQATVTNTGTTSAGAFKVQWYLSTDSEYSIDDILLERTNGAGNTYAVAGVAAGKSTSVISVNLQLPEELPAGWDGYVFYLVMRTDVDDEVAEVDETNNSGQIGGGFDNRALAFGRTTRAPANGFDIDLSMTGLTVNQQAYVQAAAYRWQAVIIGDLPEVYVEFKPGDNKILDDLLIFVDAQLIDGPSNVLGFGGPSAVRDSNGLPWHGSVTLDVADLGSMEDDGLLFDTVLHEFGHVLGLITIKTDTFVMDDMNGNPVFVGPKAIQAYADLLGVDPADVEGVPLESQDDKAHWSEAVFGDEIMTPFAGVDEALSIVSIMALADLGYQVNPTVADPYALPAPGPAPAANSGSGAGGQFARTAGGSASHAPLDTLPLDGPVPILTEPKSESSVSTPKPIQLTMAQEPTRSKLLPSKAVVDAVFGLSSDEDIVFATRNRNESSSDPESLDMCYFERLI